VASGSSYDPWKGVRTGGPAGTVNDDGSRK